MHTSTLAPEYDAVIVGARCAGSATAASLARRGMRVLVLEKGSPGRDALSTHALMRSAMLELSRLGVVGRLRQLGTPAVRVTTFHYGERELRVEIPQKDGIDCLMAPRRFLLDRVLAERAEELGARVVHGARVLDVSRSRSGRVDGVWVSGADGAPKRIGAGWVIGADGRSSTIARRVGAETLREFSNASACAYGYFSGLEPDGYHWYYERGASAGVVPTNDGRCCVFVCWPSGKFGEAERRDPRAAFAKWIRVANGALARRLESAELCEPVRAFGGAPGFLRRAAGPGWALVGDAASFRDPTTAHGISDALGQAELLGRTLGDGTDLADYAAACGALSLPIMELTDRVASFDWTLPEIAEMHLELSRGMKRHYQTLLSLGAQPSTTQNRSAWMTAT